MKKILSVVMVIIILLLISGYIENSYCHSWATTAPLGKTIEESKIIAKDYWPNNTFCNINAKISLPGGFLLAMIGLVR